jgi:hypothetical protein
MYRGSKAQRKKKNKKKIIVKKIQQPRNLQTECTERNQEYESLGSGATTEAQRMHYQPPTDSWSAFGPLCTPHQGQQQIVCSIMWLSEHYHR